MRLLLVEDDEQLGSVLQEALKRSGYAVDWLKSAEQAKTAIELEHFDLLLLDLTLPGQDGFSFLQALRTQGLDFPVIILTARDKVEDRVQGLDMGADDYLPKPFDLAELNARIKAVFRRKQGFASNQLKYANWVLDLASHQLKIGGQPVELSHKEFELLKIFVEKPGRILSKRFLEESLYSWSDSVNSNSVEVHIHHLRKKLPKGVIKTIRGLGYQLQEDQEV